MEKLCLLKSKPKFLAVGMISWALIALHAEGNLNQCLAQSLLPEKLTFNEIYEAGSGLPVGKILSVWGDVVIMHADMTDGYLAKVGFPLFKGDTIVTTENGSFGCKLNDGSTIRLAPNSRLSINQSAHDTKRKSSFSELSLIPGNAYIKIAKLDEFEARDFKVETDVVVAGGRQADFILLVTEGINEISALKDASLEVVSLEDPEQNIVLSDFQRAVIREGVLPMTVETIPAKEAALLVSKFYQVPEGFSFDMALNKLGQAEILEDEDIQEEDLEEDDFRIIE